MQDFKHSLMFVDGASSLP